MNPTISLMQSSVWWITSKIVTDVQPGLSFYKDPAHSGLVGLKEKPYIILSYNKVKINVHMHHLAVLCLPCTRTLGSALPVPLGVCQVPGFSPQVVCLLLFPCTGAQQPTKDLLSSNLVYLGKCIYTLENALI